MSTTTFDLAYPAAFSTASHPRPIPAPDGVLGEWYIAYTCLPYWKDKRNVKWTYSGSAVADLSQDPIDDVIAYQAPSADKIKTIRGTNTPAPGQPGAWNWRGSGWAKIVSNHWELLGYGSVDGLGEWQAAFSGKSFFNPAGITLSTRTKGGFSEALRQEFDEALRGMVHRDLEGLAQGMFRVKHD